MTASFTPGPWTVEPATPGLRAPCEDGAADMMIVASNHLCPGIILWDDQGLPEQSANWRLIAAAPDLLAALKHLVHWHDQLGPQDIAKAQAAITKATGAA